MKDTLRFYENIYEPLFQKGYTKKSNRAAPSIEALERWQESVGVVFNSVLDVGCAWGKTLTYWKEQNIPAEGVDVSPRAVHRCKSNGLKAHHASATQLSMFADKQFDLYMSTDVYEHLREEDLVDAIHEAKRVTKRFILIRAHPTIDKRGELHLTVWSNEKWKEFFESQGLEIIPIGNEGSWHYKNTHLMRIPEE